MSDGVIMRQIVLRQPGRFASDRKPRITLCLTTWPGCRPDLVLDEVGPHADEVVVVAVGVPPAETAPIRDRLASAAEPHSMVEVNPDSYPHLYFRDVRETYEAGPPLAGERYAGPLTGDRLVASWSSVRNLGWGRSSQDWQLALDGCDCLVNPSYAASVCEAIGEFSSDLGYVPRADPGHPDRILSVAASAKIARNGSHCRWEGTAGESIEGSRNVVLIDGSLSVIRRTRDPRPEAKMVNDFKALYANARRSDWQISPGDLIRMARLARAAGMEDNFADSAISAYLDLSPYPEERAWACAVQGEILESRRDLAGAALWYEQSLEERPGYKSAFRLCRARFMLDEWEGALDAFQIGVDSEHVIHVIDDDPVWRGPSLVFAVIALVKLGRVAEARERGETLRRLYPYNQTITRLCDEI
jgi:hypothetical protein